MEEMWAFILGICIKELSWHWVPPGHQQFLKEQADQAVRDPEKPMSATDQQLRPRLQVRGGGGGVDRDRWVRKQTLSSKC